MENYIRDDYQRKLDEQARKLKVLERRLEQEMNERADLEADFQHVIEQLELQRNSSFQEELL